MKWGTAMPTFERCAACVASGKPAEDSPILPEGAICQGCQKIASERDHANVCRHCGIGFLLPADASRHERQCKRKRGSRRK